MTPRVGRAIVPLLCLLFACSDSTPGSRCPAVVPGEGISVDEYCPTFAALLCDGYAGCGCLEGERQECIDWVLEECEAGEVSSIRGGNSCLDPVVAKQCLDARREAFADCQFNEDLDAACRFQWYGFSGVGEPCRDVWYCQPGLSCQIDGVEGHCVQLPAEGEPCDETAHCRPEGLYCSYEDWICHRDPRLGEPCETERDNTCAEGVCLEGICQAREVCG